MGDSQQIPHQPLHPLIREKLDSAYVKLHDEVIQFVTPVESQLWTPDPLLAPNPFARGAQALSEVGLTLDRDVGNFQARVLVPDGSAPESGWPCLIWYHGGGWVYGGLDSENAFLTHVCKHVGCVVVSINYRHAPAYAYPAAMEDSISGFQWVTSPETIASFSLDPARVALGGLSAGGGLATIVAMKIGLQGVQVPKPVFQLLLCPVIDNNATIDSAWATSQYAPWLTPGRMLWYREQYFRSTSDTHLWDASPNLAPADVLEENPATFIAVAECDLLAPEDLAYAQSLKDAGVDTEVKVYKGATHSILLLAGTHKLSQQLVHDSCEALARHLHTSYRRDDAPIVAQGRDSSS